MTAEHARRQLAALAEVTILLEQEDLPYWLFGGWAVDFYVGARTRPHDDVDLAVWLHDAPRIAELLVGDAWEHAPQADEDGGTAYERGSVRLELTYLVRERDGSVVTPLRDGAARWSDGAFSGDVAALDGVRARLVALTALRESKSRARSGADDAAKDVADLEWLSALQTL